MQDYIVVNGREFRKGYTTGSCAAAAAKAAVLMLQTGTRVEEITIGTPSGGHLLLKVSNPEQLTGKASCSVKKDGGDDPDVTHGLDIFAEAVYSQSPGVIVKGGYGVGIVTLPGLKVPVGEPAINPVPLQMIKKEVQEVLGKGRGMQITIHVSGGREIAAKTYNPKLGIEGGISILGTSGIVMPMSEEAWKDALELELSVLWEKGVRQLVYTFGNYGETYAVHELGIEEGRIVKISNFLGFMLDKAVERGFSEILLVGHLGKLVKAAAGIFHTHSRVADARMEILTAYAALEGAPAEVAAGIYACRTTDAAAEIIRRNRLEGIYRRIADNASRRCSEYTFGRVRVGTVLFNEDNHLLAMDGTAREMCGKWDGRNAPVRRENDEKGLCAGRRAGG